MKQEPELIDIFAMFALMGLLSTAPKNASREEIAYESYLQAEAVIEAREKFLNSEGKRNERN